MGDSICTIPGCGKPHKSLGLCAMHRMRLKRSGTTADWQDRRDCPSCLTSFLAPSANAIYCSTRCREKVRHEVRRLDPQFVEGRRAYSRVYSAANREKYRQASALWREQNRERHRQLSLEWWRKNRYSTPMSWRAQNLDKHAARERRRMGRLRAQTPVPIEHALVVAKMAYWGNSCWICAGPFEAVDHVKPLARGGLNVIANLRPICVPCNSRKRDRWNGPHALSMFIRQ